MKYLRIKNTGMIEPQALHLVGASTKRNDNSKIGQFGSGNKYALAYLLRNNHEVQIFAGQQAITIETKQETFRDNVFNLIYINGEKTSITSEMGKDWQLWQAIREIYCNAIDEGSPTIDLVQSIEPKDDETHFYIDNKHGVMEFMVKFDDYFAINKKVLFECKNGRILEKSGETANVYRKGIKCFNTKKTSVYDYDFNNIEIDEDRIVKYGWQVEEMMWDLIYRCDVPEVIQCILHQCSKPEVLEGSISDWSDISIREVSDEFKAILKNMNIAAKGYAGLLKPDEIHRHVIIPTKVFESVRGLVDDENVGKAFRVSRHGSLYRELDTTPLQHETIRLALAFLEEVGMGISYPIVVAVFDNKDVMGAAVNGKIILSENGLERGVNDVVNTIIEEYIHLKYDVLDETRGFQTAIITEFISYMKKVNSFAI